MNTVEEEIERLHNLTQEQYEALRPREQRQLEIKLQALNRKREKEKKDKAQLDDVLSSMQEIAKRLPDVDMTKASAFADVLLRNRITKWELRVATEEIIRTRTKFTAVAEYFLAIDRLKRRLSDSNHNIFHDNALDF